MMKLLLKSLGLMTTLICLVYSSLFFIFEEPKPDFTKTKVSDASPLCLSEIFSDYHANDSWKSETDVRIDFDFEIPKQFHGQKIVFKDGSEESELWIGVTSYATARYEYWKNGTMVEEKEIGFMKKITNHEPLQLSITRSPSEKSSINQETYQMRLHKNQGFFGDHAIISVDLNDLPINDRKIIISHFSKGINSNSVNAATFENLRLWSKYESPD